MKYKKIGHPLQFAPIPIDNDELLNELDEEVHEEPWNLKETIDGERLTGFWEDVLQTWNQDN